MNMGTVNVNSAQMVYQWNRSAETVVNHDDDLSRHIDNTQLNENSKKELLLELTGKRRTMLEGAVFMMKNKAQFADLNRALELLNAANNSYSLAAVEAALQTQIDVVCEMKSAASENDKALLTENDKALCLYTLQNMIFALSDYNLKNGKANDYVPQILQDQYQMLLKGSMQNLNWDKLNDSVYTMSFEGNQNPTLAKWKFLDKRMIKQNMNSMYQSAHNEAAVENLRGDNDTTMKAEQGVVNWGTVEVNKTSDAEINKILNWALIKFDSKTLKNNLPELFNFVKGAVVAQNDANEVNYPILHEVSMAAMRRIVEIGNNQQKRAMMGQTQMEEKSL